MKPIVFPLLATLAGLTGAQAQSPKPGTISPVFLEATVMTGNPPVTGNLPGGKTRKSYTLGSVRLINRDLLQTMRLAGLLDGTVTGWSIQRLAAPDGSGNLYATKAAKAAVAVPANLLTPPAALGSVTTGTEITPPGGSPVRNLLRRVHAGLGVLNGDCTGAGIQSVKTGYVRAGGTTTAVLTTTENFNLTGTTAAGTGIIAGSYRVTSSRPADLSRHLPGDAIP